MYIPIVKINKRQASINSHAYSKAMYNLNESNLYCKDIFSLNNANYMLEHWRDLDANDENNAFAKALDIFNEICKNCSDGDIRTASNYISEGILTVKDAQQLLRSIKMRNARLKNATKVTTKIARKIEDINKANERKIKDIQSNLQTKINTANTGSAGDGNVSPDVDGAELDNTSSVAQECYNKFLEEAKFVYQCDRVVNNYNKIAKRFNFDKMITEVYSEDLLYDTIVEMASCIDTYDIPFKNKYNSALENTYYIFSKHHMNYPTDKLIEAVTDYFIFNTPVDESTVLDIDKVKDISVLFNESDFNRISYLYNDVYLTESAKLTEASVKAKIAILKKSNDTSKMLIGVIALFGAVLSACILLTLIPVTLMSLVLGLLPACAFAATHKQLKGVLNTISDAKKKVKKDMSKETDKDKLSKYQDVLDELDKCENIVKEQIKKNSIKIKKESAEDYGVDLYTLTEADLRKSYNKAKSTLKDWSKGNPEERKDDKVNEMIAEFRIKCAKDKKNNKENNLVYHVKALATKMFTQSPDSIVNGFPNLFSLIRTFFIVGTCAINPIISVVAFIGDRIINIKLSRKQYDKVIEKYRKEISNTKSKIEKTKNDTTKERLEKYSEQLKKDLDKIEYYARSYYTDEENDERDMKSYEYDDDINIDDTDWDFGEDDWGDDTKLEQRNMITNAASILLISELAESIEQGLETDSIDGIIKNNIARFDDDTIDDITDFSITVPAVINRGKLSTILTEYRDDLRKHENASASDYVRICCLNENISKLESAPISYNTINDTKSIIAELNWIEEMARFNSYKYINEMTFTNTLKLAMNKLKKNAVKLSDKEKQISNNIDLSMRNIEKGIEDSLTNNSREAIIRGRVLPSASKTIKLALAAGAAWAVNPAVAVIGALGAFACSSKLKAKERQLVLDDIEIELKMCERYLHAAEEKNDMEAIRQIEITQRSLQRQRQRIKYKMNIIYNQDVPDVNSGGAVDDD